MAAKTRITGDESKIAFSAVEKEGTEALVALLALGVVKAVKTNAVSIDFACTHLFTPVLLEHIRKDGLDERLWTLVNLGADLEFAERIVPDAISKSINELEDDLIKYIKSKQSKNLRDDRWVIRIPQR